MLAQVKTWFIFHLFMGLTFLLSGLILNAIQLCIYLTIRPFNKRLYRSLNFYLIYSSWSQLVAITEWWSGSECRLYMDDETRQHFGKEHGLVVMNHKYELDWLMCWMACDKLRVLGNAKTFAKTSLRKIPIIGWGWIFAEMIFLERNWERDSQILGQGLDHLLAYQDPMLLLLFSEGTRFTVDKHKASMEFARKKNLKELKHHLLPRTKGFVYCLQHFKNKGDAAPVVYDIQLGFSKDLAEPTFSSVLFGRRMVSDMCVRRFCVKDIPTDSEEECSQWLYDLYQQKDKLMDEYLRTGSFPGNLVEHPRRLAPLINWVSWMTVLGTPILYGFWKMFASGNTYVIVSAATILALVFSVMYLMIGTTKINHGSAYGTETHNGTVSTGGGGTRVTPLGPANMETIYEGTEDQATPESTTPEMTNSLASNGPYEDNSAKVLPPNCGSQANLVERKTAASNVETVT